jgi:hypothetical protein
MRFKRISHIAYRNRCRCRCRCFSCLNRAAASLHACGANYPALPEPGARNFACGANYQHAPGTIKTKGGLFCICVESRNLT